MMPPVALLLLAARRESGPTAAATLWTIVSLLGRLMEQVERREFPSPDIKSRKMRLRLKKKARNYCRPCACDGQAYGGRAALAVCYRGAFFAGGCGVLLISTETLLE